MIAASFLVLQPFLAASAGEIVAVMRPYARPRMSRFRL
jgi:hypothetical protein